MANGDKRYRTPKGNVYTETELREKMGDKFGVFVTQGKLQPIDDDGITVMEQEFEEIFVTPKGSEYTKREMVDKMGAEKFDEFLLKGLVKKKEAADSQGPSLENIQSQFSSPGADVQPPPPEIPEVAQDNTRVARGKPPLQGKSVKELVAEQEAQIKRDKEFQELVQKQLKERQEGDEQAQLKRKELIESDAIQKLIQLTNSENLKSTFNQEVMPYQKLQELYGDYGLTFTPKRGTRHNVVASVNDGTKTFEVNLFERNPNLEQEIQDLQGFINSNLKLPIEEKTDEEQDELNEITQAYRIKNLRKVPMIDENGMESTVRLMSYEEDGRHFVVPTLFPIDPDNYNTNPNTWYLLNPNDAIKLAKKRGEVFEYF